MNDQEQQALDLAEKGREGQRLDRRLFMQLQVFTGCVDVRLVIEQLEGLGGVGVDAVLYENLHDPRGVGLLTMSERPEDFVEVIRPALQSGAMGALEQRHEYTMFGRTYALGYEADLQETLFTRPRSTALNRDWPWAVWYPLRRGGAFEQLEPGKKREILQEHGSIGFAFGRGDYAHDIRLACHGLDPNDNDFVLGLLGKQLHPLSKLVESMRKTQQTSLYLQRLGPFFVGRAMWWKSMDNA